MTYIGDFPPGYWPYGPGPYGPATPAAPNTGPTYTPQWPQHYIPQGCICPPTCEKTCESPTCPRQNHNPNRVGNKSMSELLSDMDRIAPNDIISPFATGVKK